MTKSGTHDNDAFNIVQVAMREFHGFTLEESPITPGPAIPINRK